MWHPRLWVFGTLRTALQTFDNGVTPPTPEWVNRFDLFANLQLTGTEKIVFGIRPLDKNRFNAFSGYAIEEDRVKNELNANIRTFFFEGDFGSLFPNLDKQGFLPIDLGFSIGRQPLLFQDGILINDTVDSLGLVRNNVRLPGVSNLRISGVYGWDELDTRNDDRPICWDFSSRLTYRPARWSSTPSTSTKTGPTGALSMPASPQPKESGTSAPRSGSSALTPRPRATPASRTASC